MRTFLITKRKTDTTEDMSEIIIETMGKIDLDIIPRTGEHLKYNDVWYTIEELYHQKDQITELRVTDFVLKDKIYDGNY